jgi:SAM-dependent methyltransferase
MRRWLAPGWPDSARGRIQEPVFRSLLDGHELSGRCLNAGAGENLFGPMLDSFAGLTEIVDIDLSAPDISRFDSNRHTSLAASLEDLPFEDASFDFAVCTEVLQHIEDDSRAAGELSRVLRSGSLALISTPTPPAPFERPWHVREGYTLDQVQALLSAVGLEILDHRYCFHWFMRMLSRTWHWQWRRLGRERRNFMPYGVVMALGWADRTLRLGKPWDLAVLARRVASA